MSIQKPYNLSIKDKVIDGKLPYILSWKTSGDTSASFSISIYNNATGILVWSLPRTYSYAMSYTIPANSISNGNEYKIEITVWNVSDQSATSQFVVFTTSSTPVVTINSIGVIGNHSNLFSATYSQAENNPLSTYKVNLYNSDRTLWKTSGLKTDVLLEHRFDLMKNNQIYYIEFIVTSKKGLTTTSGLFEFSVVYENPNMYFAINAESLSEKASIKLDWTVAQVIAKTSIVPSYLNNTELDVRTGKVFFDEGFEISSDFTLKIWAREIESNKDLIYLSGSNGFINIQYENDKFLQLNKTCNGYSTHYKFPLNIGTSNVFLCVQQKNGKMDMNAEVF